MSDWMHTFRDNWYSNLAAFWRYCLICLWLNKFLYLDSCRRSYFKLKQLNERDLKPIYAVIHDFFNDILSDRIYVQYFKLPIIFIFIRLLLNKFVRKLDSFIIFNLNLTKCRCWYKLTVHSNRILCIMHKQPIIDYFSDSKNNYRNKMWCQNSNYSKFIEYWSYFILGRYWNKQYWSKESWHKRLFYKWSRCL
jgi:hypothetical protein